MNKTAFVISIILTTFVLMAVGGIAYAMNRPQAPAAPTGQEAVLDEAAVDPNQVQAADPAAAQASDPALEQALAERETAYQQLITEANARLAQAQQQQLQLQAQVNALQTGGAAATAPQATLTLDQAAQIASDFLGQTSVYSVELVTIRDVPLYKVTFYSGDIVYVSMDGQIVGSASNSFNETAWAAPDLSGGGGQGASQTGSSGGGEHENESGERDDD